MCTVDSPVTYVRLEDGRGRGLLNLLPPSQTRNSVSLWTSSYLVTSPQEEEEH